MNSSLDKQNPIVNAVDKFRFKPWHIFLLAGLIVLLVISIHTMKSYKSYAQDELTKQELDMDYIYFNVFASDIQLGGLTKEQAKKKLEKELNVDMIEGRTVELTTYDMTYQKTLTYEELGMSYNVDELVEKAYNYGRTGTEKERLAAIQKLQNVGNFLAPVISYDDAKVRAAIEAIEPDVNASLVSGKKLNVERAVQMLEEQLTVNNYGATIYLPEE
jgi:hypothetical protein